MFSQPLHEKFSCDFVKVGWLRDDAAPVERQSIGTWEPARVVS